MWSRIFGTVEYKFIDNGTSRGVRELLLASPDINQGLLAADE